MAGFIVTVPFTRNGIAGTAIYGVGASFAPSIAESINFAQNTIELFIKKNPVDVVVFGTLTAVPSPTYPS